MVRERERETVLEKVGCRMGRVLGVFRVGGGGTT